ncbi:hypothetical protein BDV10DRAFT_146726 [Aspergillus recurvatus]
MFYAQSLSFLSGFIRISSRPLLVPKIPYRRLISVATAQAPGSEPQSLAVELPVDDVLSISALAGCAGWKWWNGAERGPNKRVPLPHMFKFQGSLSGAGTYGRCRYRYSIGNWRGNLGISWDPLHMQQPDHIPRRVDDPLHVRPSVRALKLSCLNRTSSMSSRAHPEYFRLRAILDPLRLWVRDSSSDNSANCCPKFQVSTNP